MITSCFFFAYDVLTVCEWTEGESAFIIEKYEQYLPLAGPMKNFKKKKDLWKQIALDLDKIFKVKVRTVTKLFLSEKRRQLRIIIPQVIQDRKCPMKSN